MLVNLVKKKRSLGGGGEIVELIRCGGKGKHHRQIKKRKKIKNKKRAHGQVQEKKRQEGGKNSKGRKRL